MIILMKFPEGKSKAFTLSYDDGHRCDLRFLDIINKYNLKSTFNLNMGIVATSKDSSRLMREEYSCYEGHEVATHGYTHPFFSEMTPELVTYEITKDRSEAEAFFGKLVRGHAYAYGDYDNKAIEILRNAGIAYARTTKSTGGFSIPDEFLAWHPTCHHREERIFGLIDRFLNEKPKYKPYLFYVWGHTYEFDFGVEYNNWEHAEKFCSAVSGHEDTVWYATNIEICDYVTAYKRLVFSMDGKIVYNPTVTDVWFGFAGSDEIVKVPAGETVKI